MRLYCLEREQWLPRPIDEVFSFFSRPKNLQAITPPWLDFRMVETPSSLDRGALIHYRLRLRRIPVRWTSEITVWDPPHRFVDRQIAGPYLLWNHDHSFHASEGRTLMCDFVTYALPLGPLGEIARSWFIKRDLKNLFDFRAEAMRQLFPGPLNER